MDYSKILWWSVPPLDFQAKRHHLCVRLYAFGHTFRHILSQNLTWASRKLIRTQKMHLRLLIKTCQIKKKKKKKKKNTQHPWFSFFFGAGRRNFALTNTVNPEYFVRTQFSYPGLSDLSYTWNFRTVADRCGFSDLRCTFRMHFIFVQKPPRTKYTKITCLRNILDLQKLPHVFNGSHWTWLTQSYRKNTTHGTGLTKTAEKNPKEIAKESCIFIDGRQMTLRLSRSAVLWTILGNSAS